MKKLLILSIISIFVLTGCGAGATNTMSCSISNTANNVTTKVNYNIDYEGTEVKKVRISYNYDTNNNMDTDNDGNNDIDGVGTGTDGTTNDSQVDDDGIIDGVVGSAIDGIVGGVTDVILDMAGIRDRHATVQSTYNNINGFSIQNTTDTDNSYKVTYVIDYDTISDTDLSTLNLSRDIDTFKSNYVAQGYTCK